MEALKILHKKFRASRRRWIQKGIRKGDSGVEDDDSQFEQHYEQYLGIESALKQFQQHVKDYCLSLQKVCEMQSKIAGDLLYFFDTDSDHRPKVASYLQQNQAMGRACGMACRALEDNVIAPVGIHIELFPDIKKIVKKRNNKRTDMLAYRRQCEDMAKNSRASGSRKHQRKIEKRDHAEAIFDKINGDLENIFQAYIEFREQMLDHYIHYVMDAQVKFYDTAAPRSKEIQAIVAEFEKVSTGLPANIEVLATRMADNLRKFEQEVKSGSFEGSGALLAEGRAGAATADRRLRGGKEGGSATERKPMIVHENQKFDINLPFERRHRLAAPSDEEYKRTGRKQFELAIYAYKAQRADELSFGPGDLIQVVDFREGGWWLGVLNDTRGLFPSNYTQPCVT